MTYLYGDSTEAGLTTNFLEYLRDAIDFAVFVLQADEKLKAGKAKAAAASDAASAEIARVERFTAVVATAVEGADKGGEGTPAAQCAARVSELLASASRQTIDAVRAKLASDMAAIDAEEAATREACHAALAAYLGPHASEDAGTTRHLALLDSGRYDASLSGSTPFDVGWTFSLAIPEGNLWASPVRLERLSPQLEIKTPQMTGWLSKEVKTRPQRIEKHAVTELTQSGPKTSFKLRIEAAAETGFDVEGEGDRVKMTRIGPAEDGAVGPFEVDPTDAVVLVELIGKLCTAADELTRAKLESANAAADGARSDFRAQPTFLPLVERLIGTLAPVVREIARRSLTPTELILRRSLADNRREEVFVAKSTLREKYAGLSAPLRALFMPLGLDGPAPTPAPAPVAPAATPPPRAEIRRSQPPIAMPTPAIPITATGPLPPISAPPARKASVPPPAPESSSGRIEGKNEAFREAVTKVLAVLKSGRTDEGYAQYAELLASTAFAAYSADDQRQALKVLLKAKAPPSRSEPVLRAYRIALTRIQSLVDTLAEPSDYEMLGVAHLQLEDKTKASAAFDRALKLERARNPSSELSISLARRISQLT